MAARRKATRREAPSPAPPPPDPVEQAKAACSAYWSGRNRDPQTLADAIRKLSAAQRELLALWVPSAPSGTTTGRGCDFVRAVIQGAK